MDFKIEYTDKEITPWSGLVLMKKMIETCSVHVDLRKLAQLVGCRNSPGFKSAHALKLLK